jgi:hypothetical protein
VKKSDAHTVKIVMLRGVVRALKVSKGLSVNNVAELLFGVPNTIRSTMSVIGFNFGLESLTACVSCASCRVIVAVSLKALLIIGFFVSLLIANFLVMGVTSIFFTMGHISIKMVA